MSDFGDPRRAGDPALTAALAAAASGLLYGAAFPPLGLHPLAWVALVPLLWALGRVRPWTGAGLGLLFSVVGALGTAGFLPGMISDFFHAPALVGWAAAGAVFVAFSGVYYAAFGAWASWCIRRRGLHPIWLACGWGACEFARASLLIPNPWGLSGYSQVPWPTVIQTADLAGPFGVGILIAVVNVALAAILVPARRPAHFAAGLALAATLCGGALLYGSWRLGQTFAEGKPIEVALVQSAIDREQRFGPPHRQANLERHLELTSAVSEAAPELVLWPEFAVDFYLREPTTARTELLRAVGWRGGELLLGAPDYRVREWGTAYYNSAFLLRAGRIVDHYDKVRLMPFSETNPLRPWVAIGADRYTPGARVRPIRSRHAEVGVLLCSEALSPAHARELSLAGAELLANPSNDDWFGSGAGARMQLHIAAVRAVENRRYLVRPTVSGFTAVVDPHGRIRAELRQGSAEVLLSSVRGSRSETPYQRWGDVVPVTAIALTLFSTLTPFAASPRPSWRRRS